MTEIEKKFLAAMLAGDLNVIKQMIKQKEIQPDNGDSWGICNASNNGYIHLVKYFLSFKKVNPAVRNNFSIFEAFQNKHMDIVYLLLQQKEVLNLLKSDSSDVALAIMKLHTTNEKIRTF